MKTEIEKPTLESLGLVASITANGVKSMNDGENPMCAWICTFTSKRGHSENFDYFTGSGCGPQPTENELRQGWPAVANVPKSNRYNIKDKALICQIAHTIAFRRKWTPDAIEILWAIARDGDALESTFEDWASDFGYDADSRKAEKIYRACQDNALRLRKILSPEAIETIKALEL